MPFDPTMGISYKIELNKVMMSKEAKKNYVEEMKNLTKMVRYDCSISRSQCK